MPVEPFMSYIADWLYVTGLSVGFMRPVVVGGNNSKLSLTM